MTLSSKIEQLIENRKDKKIVFTNGCFDILHVGHVSYLAEAKSMGDLLIVGLNSDESVKKLKGPSRPINSEDKRKYILEALRCVDGVQIFHEQTPIELIKLIKPDVLVKGGDWPIEKIVGHEFVKAYGGEVLSLGIVEGQSTTNIIDALKA